MPLVSLTKEDRDWCLHRMRPYHIELMKQYSNSLFVAGGFIRSCISNEKINDIDMFCPSPEHARECADRLRYVVGKVVHESKNALTLRTPGFATQFIHRWTFTNPLECIQSFDFTIAKAAIWWDGSQWMSTCDERFYSDLAAKRLTYCSPIREEEAGGSMLRVLKFYQRGYRIPMDSLGAVIARIAMSAGDALMDGSEANLTPIITGLLREVDPDIDPDHTAHLPASNQTVSTFPFDNPVSPLQLMGRFERTTVTREEIQRTERELLGSTDGRDA